MRAKIIKKDQEINPIVYARYYLFIEKCVYYFREYERQLMEIKMNQKDDKIYSLENLVKQMELNLGNKINEQTEIIKEVKDINIKQTEIITEVKNINLEQNEKIDELNNNIVDIKRSIDNALIPIRSIYSNLMLTPQNIGMSKALRLLKYHLKTEEMYLHIISYIVK